MVSEQSEGLAERVPQRANPEGVSEQSGGDVAGDRPVRVTIIGKPDCHLCVEAEAVVAVVCADLDVGWEKVSIMDDPALFDRYWEQVPVILVDGEQHDFWRVDGVRLRAALTG